MKLSNTDYKKILKFYKLSIPKHPQNIKKKANKIIAKKFCGCIKKVQKKFKKEGISIGICTKSVITRKGYKRGKFRCKKRRTIKLQKGGDDGFEHHFTKLISDIGRWRDRYDGKEVENAKPKDKKKFKEIFIDHLKDFIIYYIEKKGIIEINNNMTIKNDIFIIKESRTKKKNKGLLSKFKNFGSGSTSSSVIYTQWWRYIIKKCKNTKVRKQLTRTRFVTMRPTVCEGLDKADTTNQNSASWLFTYITGKKNIGNDPYSYITDSDQKLKAVTEFFTVSKDSIVHQAKVAAFEELSNESKEQSYESKDQSNESKDQSYESKVSYESKG